MSVFSERVSALMSKRGLTQKDLSAKAGVTESAMSYYVNGSRVPRSDVLARIAKALGTSTDYLLGVSDKETFEGNDDLLYLQRNLGKLDSEELRKAEKILKAVFEDIFEDDKD